MKRHEELYRMYEADKLLLMTDTVMTGAQKARRLTELTYELLEAEAEAGVVWHPVGSVTVVGATGDGAALLEDRE